MVESEKSNLYHEIDFSIHYEDGENGIREKENKRRERNGMRFIRAACEEVNLNRFGQALRAGMYVERLVQATRKIIMRKGREKRKKERNYKLRQGR